MEHLIIPLFIYFLLVNCVSFLMMYLDKQFAIKKLWRIPEKILFLVAIIGGSVGAIFGMQAFHHKTKHSSFVFGMPIILILQLLFLTLYSKLF